MRGFTLINRQALGDGVAVSTIIVCLTAHG